MEINADTVATYVTLLKTAEVFGKDLVDIVKSFVANKLTPAELALLENAWQEDVDRSAKNAAL
jgi:hypothetical protein